MTSVQTQKTRIIIKAVVVILLFCAWFAFNYPGLKYGTGIGPIFSTEWGDEQTPINGALHVAEQRNILALHNLKTLVYGPGFAAMLVPVVAEDYLSLKISGAVKSSEDYKRAVVLDFGRLMLKGRVLATVAGFLSLFVLFVLLSAERVADNRMSRWTPLAGAAFLALNHYFFLQSHVLHQWIFACLILFIQFFLLRNIVERDKKIDWATMVLVSAMGFSIGFFFALYQIMWLPFLWQWIRAKDKSKLKRFFWYALSCLGLYALAYAWDPWPYVRMLTMSGESQFKVSFLFLPSLFYYIKIIVVNQPFLTLACLVVVFLTALRKVNLKIWDWAILVTGMVHLLFFSSSVHAEPRYALPLIAVMFYFVWRHLLRTAGKNLATYTLVVLLGFEAIFQLAHDIKWISLASRGSEENQLETMLASYPDGTRYDYQGSAMLSVLHDKESFKVYVTNCLDDEQVNLFEYYITMALPANSRLYHVEYACVPDYSSERDGEYTIIPSGTKLFSNYFEEEVVRLWDYGQNGRKYTLKKVSGGRIDQ